MLHVFQSIIRKKAGGDFRHMQDMRNAYRWHFNVSFCTNNCITKFLIAERKCNNSVGIEAEPFLQVSNSLKYLWLDDCYRELIGTHLVTPIHLYSCRLMHLPPYFWVNPFDQLESLQLSH